MGNIMEGTPISYCNSKKVQTIYVVNDSEIHFKVSDYNSAQTLTVDPVLVWATYYPGGSDDVYAMQDDGKNVWITGVTPYSGFPTLNPGGGAYFQGTISAGAGNAFILQFNTSGVLQWATFYGGSGYDYAYSIQSDGTNVWLTGYTTSTNFPVLNPGGGAYFQGTGTGADAFILQFSTSGVLKWATYYGGNGATYGYSIQSDGKNVWMTGTTTSTNLPTFNPGGGAYFQATNAGHYNVCIVQFTTTGVLKWATYYGGTAIDEGASINSDGTNVWVTGLTQSTNFPTFNPGNGAYFQGSGAGGDAFILQFSTSGVLKWATYYGGSKSDRGLCIYSDKKNVWVTGQTASFNFPIFNPGNGTYFQGSNGNSTAFILQFDTAGTRKWATYYGGSTADFGVSIESDGTNVWVCGGTTSPDFPVFKSACGFNQDTLGNGPYDDVFILQFSTTGVRKWATYYGTDGENDASFAWSDGSNLFVAGDAESNGYPTKNPGGGAYYLNTSNGAENVFVGKFIITADSGKLVVSPTVSICRGDTTTITASGAVLYSWSPPTGLSATNIPNPVASPTVTTTYTVTAINTGACGGTFVDSVKVMVDTFKSKVTIPKDTSICIGSSIILSVSGGGNYQWSTGNTTNSIFIANDSTTHTYTVSISNGVCKKDTSILVTVNAKPKGNVTGNLVICKGDSTTLAASGGTLYKWSTGQTTSDITVSPSSDTNYSVQIIQNGCADTLSESITVHPSPSINICCDSIISAGQTVQLISSGGGSYQWSPATGLSCITCPDPIASPYQTTTYTLTIANDSGCIVQSFVTIDIGCGTVFVPDVFSPNEAHNNIFYVRGTCIVSMDFLVFDRWGNKVFESENPANGWDGTYNGKPMNMATYVWTLKATLRDGTSIKKHGDVTLVR